MVTRPGMLGAGTQGFNCNGLGLPEQGGGAAGLRRRWPLAALPPADSTVLRHRAGAQRCAGEGE